MPTNLYGPNDNFDLQSSHVLPAMIRKFYEAKENDHAPVTLWGTGTPKREFMHVDDLAQAVLFAMENKLPETLYNIGTGKDLSIKELAEMIQKTIGHQGDIVWDDSKPDGTPRKLMDVTKLKKVGFEPEIDLQRGVEATFVWYRNNNALYA
jgi:GDP-L-fucose synthase